jgi:hypothetical protein
MISRVLSVLLAAAAAVAVAVVVPRAMPYHAGTSPAAAPRITRAPAHYVGVVTPRLADFDREAGVRVNLAAYYLRWGQPVPVSLIDGDALLGAETLAELQPMTAAGRPVSFAAITAGRYDRWLRSVAHAIRASGDLVMVSFAQEANGNWDAWGDTSGVTPAAYIAAWRHVHDTMSAGGTRITWLWQQAPQSAAGIAPLAERWPGSRYVNLVGLDDYLYVHPDTLATVFSPSIADIRLFTRAPVLISETAVGPVEGQAQSIPGMFADVRTMHLAGLVWFNVNQHAGVYHQAWALSGTAAITAFRAGVRSLIPASRPR